MASETTARGTDFARARSAAYGLIAGALRYPDRPGLDTLTEPEPWSAWPERLGEIDVEATDKLVTLRERLGKEAAGLAHDPGAEPENLQSVYVHLFGHTVRGTCPPYELEYAHGEILQQAADLADVNGFYSAFGMDVADDGNERADHVAVECEFMSVLAAKEAYALNLDDGEALTILGDAQRSFLADHLGRWLPALAQRVRAADPGGFYGAVADFAACFIAAECRRFEITCGPRYLELRPADESSDAAITCGADASCPENAADPLVQISIDPSMDTTR